LTVRLSSIDAVQWWTRFDELTEPITPIPEEHFGFRNHSELLGIINTNTLTKSYFVSWWVTAQNLESFFLFRLMYELQEFLKQAWGEQQVKLARQRNHIFLNQVFLKKFWIVLLKFIVKEDSKAYNLQSSFFLKQFLSGYNLLNEIYIHLIVWGRNGSLLDCWRWLSMKVLT